MLQILAWATDNWLAITILLMLVIVIGEEIGRWLAHG